MRSDNKDASRLEEKINVLNNILQEMGSVVIAYPGGLGSSFLLKIITGVFGGRAMAVSAISPLFPGQQVKEAKRFARTLKCRHKVINYNPLDLKEFKSNPKNRCYICKKKCLLFFST